MTDERLNKCHAKVFPVPISGEHRDRLNTLQDPSIRSYQSHQSYTFFTMFKLLASLFTMLLSKVDANANEMQAVVAYPPLPLPNYSALSPIPHPGRSPEHPAFALTCIVLGVDYCCQEIFNTFIESLGGFLNLHPKLPVVATKAEYYPPVQGAVKFWCRHWNFNYQNEGEVKTPDLGMLQGPWYMVCDPHEGWAKLVTTYRSNGLSDQVAICYDTPMTEKDIALWNSLSWQKQFTPKRKGDVSSTADAPVVVAQLEAVPLGHLSDNQFLTFNDGSKLGSLGV